MERCRDGDGEGEIRMGYCGKEMDRLKKNFEMGLEGFDLSFVMLLATRCYLALHHLQARK